MFRFQAFEGTGAHGYVQTGYQRDWVLTNGAAVRRLSLGDGGDYVTHAMTLPSKRKKTNVLRGMTCSFVLQKASKILQWNLMTTECH
jgi:hypothetical protein